MTISKNRLLIKEINGFLDENVPVKLGINKKNELIRLLYEISYTNNINIKNIFRKNDIYAVIEKGKDNLFSNIKNVLMTIRYPSLLSEKVRIMPLKIEESDKECVTWDMRLNPESVFIEKSVSGYEWTKDFIKQFPKAKIVETDNVYEKINALSKGDEITLYNSRIDNVFITKTRAAFIKKCPCTKGAVRCGYQILNIGFGCPIDCSYCYLQTYSNAPGIILPANIEDYYDYIKKLDKSVVSRTRIGTGEFTDSLALDKYTGYASKLIPFFRDTKNLVLELKTKIADIPAVMKEEPHENLVISWSINTEKMADIYEKGAASVKERVKSAAKAAKRGFKIGFHFDPIVYYKGWEKEYEWITEYLFSYEDIKKQTAWISLGSLRYTPGLKQIAERRFKENRAFYEGEFFEDTEGKLRYPEKLRVEMYKKIIKTVKRLCDSCWLYLCMEPDRVWKEAGLCGKQTF